MPARQKTRWYGVKTLFRLAATGKPKSPDRDFDPESTMVEERVVLFQARGFEDAIKQAEDEAQRYRGRTRFVNIYGQTVKLKFLGALDAFAIVDLSPSAGCEVYSSTAIVSRGVSNERLVNERFGKPEKRAAKTRHKFVDGEILSGVLAITGPGKSGRGSHKIAPFKRGV